MGFGRVIEGFIMYMQGLGSRVCCDEALKQITGRPLQGSWEALVGALAVLENPDF